jgi:hypothetical protein
MIAYGSKRCRHDCRVYRAGLGRKILYTVGVKSKKYGRRFRIELY